MLKYKGGGFRDGIPARDLTDEEVEKYGGKKLLLDTGLYEEVEKAPSTKKTSKTEEKGE